MTDAKVQRINMVDSQVRPSDVTDRRIVRAMQEVAREEFVPEAVRSIAYSDGDIALGGGRTLLAPRVFAKLIQLTTVEPDSKLLIVGSGTGYSAAVMARLCGVVFALESDARLSELARPHLEALPSIKMRRGALTGGLPESGPYDAILIEGAVAAVPAALLDQLTDGGRLVAIVQGPGTGQAVVWRKTGTSFGDTAGFDAVTSVLPGFEGPIDFRL